MNEKYVLEIEYNWIYSRIYSFYDIIADKEDAEESFDNWNDGYRVVNGIYIIRTKERNLYLLK